MISEEIKAFIDYTISYVGNSSDDWFRVKMQIINNMPSKFRSLFSRRHYSTKKHILNSFDREVIKYWESQTGIVLQVDPGKLHPKDWSNKPRGWRLIEINEERKRKREAKNSS